MAEDKWEQVVRANFGAPLDRVTVPGGWLYRDVKTGALAFVPEPTFQVRMDPGPANYQFNTWGSP